VNTAKEFSTDFYLSLVFKPGEIYCALSSLLALSLSSSPFSFILSEYLKLPYQDQATPVKLLYLLIDSV
jgi:hypothetical protein